MGGLLIRAMAESERIFSSNVFPPNGPERNPGDEGNGDEGPSLRVFQGERMSDLVNLICDTTLPCHHNAIAMYYHVT